MNLRRSSGTMAAISGAAPSDSPRSVCRLRFMLEELALPLGTTIIGRGDECDLAIEDPAISRAHVAIEVDGDAAVIRDLGSRNGTTLNGARLDGPRPLRNGDRVGVGSQIFVVVITQTLPHGPETARIRPCRACGAQCIGDAPCSECGAPELPASDVTTDALMPPADRSGWWVDLHVDTIRRALQTPRLDQAGEVFGRLREGLAERLRAGERLDTAHLDAAASAAIELALAIAAVEPLAWALSLFTRVELLPSRKVVDALSRAPEIVLLDARPQLDRLLERCRARGERLDAERAPDLDALATLVERVHAFGRAAVREREERVR
jgi:hypothetical protein